MSWLTSGARIESSLVHTNFCVKKSRTKKDLEREKMDREKSKKIGSGADRACMQQRKEKETVALKMQREKSTNIGT